MRGGFRNGNGSCTSASSGGVGSGPVESSRAGMVLAWTSMRYEATTSSTLPTEAQRRASGRVPWPIGRSCTSILR